MFICKRHCINFISSLLSRFSSCSQAYTVYLGASCVFYYYHFVWKMLGKLASTYLRKLIIPLSTYNLAKYVRYFLFKNIYCFMWFSNTTISFKFILMKHVMFLAPVPTWLFIQMWIFIEETYYSFSLVNSTRKTIIFPHSLPVVCLFANSYNHVSLCMTIGLVYFTCPDGPSTETQQFNELNCRFWITSTSNNIY